jgi:hypothetical protein
MSLLFNSPVNHVYPVKIDIACQKTKTEFLSKKSILLFLKNRELGNKKLQKTSITA